MLVTVDDLISWLYIRQDSSRYHATTHSQCLRLPLQVFLLCLFVLAPRLGSSDHTSYLHGGRHVVLRASDHDSRAPSTCFGIPSGGDGLPLMHRLSPCSPSAAGLHKSEISVGDAFYRDGLRLHALFGSSVGDNSKTNGLTIPSTGTPLVALPGANEYHVTVGFGSPAQKLTVGFDTATTGATFLQCKPCAAGAPCHKAFDPSRSSSLAQIPCGSRDCPLKPCSGRTCTAAAVTKKGTVLQNATFVTDMLTVGTETPLFNFRVACLEMGARTTDSSSGVLDLSRESHSLASRVFLSPDKVAFSYCLPWNPYNPGFLSFDTTRPERAGRRSVTYANLRRNTAHRNLYFVKLVGMSIVGDVLPVPRSTISGDALLEVHTTFTYLMPDLYAVLRDKFRAWMKGYPVAPPSGALDTCYDFTHLKSIVVTIITLRFEGGAILELGIEQTMYFKDSRNFFSVGCLAFAPLQEYMPGVAVIGSMAQAQTEVVYDLLGGKVGFVPNRCF